MTGETGFNEVLFDNLVVADRYRLDDVGTRRKVAMTTLTHERNAGVLVTPASGGKPLNDASRVSTSDAHSLNDFARASRRDGRSAADDSGVRDEIEQLVIRLEAQRQNARRVGVAALTHHPQRLPLQSKLVGSELQHDLAEVACRVVGASSTLYVSDPEAPAGGQWPWPTSTASATPLLPEPERYNEDGCDSLRHGFLMTFFESSR
jgi:alkylation response protein AidB-like acyl-CoA dehydrogenase